MSARRQRTRFKGMHWLDPSRPSWSLYSLDQLGITERERTRICLRKGRLSIQPLGRWATLRSWLDQQLMLCQCLAVAVCCWTTAWLLSCFYGNDMQSDTKESVHG